MSNPYSGAIQKEDPEKVRYWNTRKEEGGNGKGDWTRPTDKGKFDENYELIDWSNDG